MKINKNILILIDTEMIESVKLGYYLVLIDTDKQDPAGSQIGGDPKLKPLRINVWAVFSFLAHQKVTSKSNR